MLQILLIVLAWQVKAQMSKSHNDVTKMIDVFSQVMGWVRTKTADVLCVDGTGTGPQSCKFGLEPHLPGRLYIYIYTVYIYIIIYNDTSIIIYICLIH